MLPDHADEGELLVKWPQGTRGSGSGSPSLQDDLALRFDADSDAAADTLERLRAFYSSLKDNNNITGRRGNVVYNWTINEYHYPGRAMHRIFDKCVRPG